MLKMVSRIERVQETDDAAEQPSLPDQPLTRYQAFYRRSSARLDVYTRGHATEIIRLASFLIVGGVGTVVNLVAVWVFSRYTSLPYDAYIVIATEIALLCNFLLNDRFTFHSLVDSQRPFWLRCLRFHGPSALGFVLTLVISYLAHHAGHLPPVSAQAVAILIVTVVNFCMHRFWTYRAVSQTPQEQPAN
jgi:putative flippase GtrA